MTRRQWLATGLAGIGAAVWGLSRTRGVRRADFDSASELSDLASRTGKHLASVLQDACLAPSGHNTQPWRVKLESETAFRLEVEPKRVPALVDPDHREVVLSLGAFIENAAVSARAKGLELAVVPQLRSLQDESIAHISLLGRARSADATDPRIALRRTLRGRFSTRAIPGASIDQLLRGADAAGNSVVFFAADSAAGKSATEMTIEANRAQAGRDAVQEELADWLRWSDQAAARHRDGLTTEALGVEGVAGWYVRNFFRHDSSLQPGNRARASETAREQAHACGGWLVLCGGESAPDMLELGRIYERIALGARAASLGLHPMSQALEELPWRSQVSTTLGLPRPARMLLRVGLVDTYPNPVSLRRPVANVVSA